MGAKFKVGDVARVVSCSCPGVERDLYPKPWCEVGYSKAELEDMMPTMLVVIIGIVFDGDKSWYQVVEHFGVMESTDYSDRTMEEMYTKEGYKGMRVIHNKKDDSFTMTTRVYHVVEKDLKDIYVGPGRKR